MIVRSSDQVPRVTLLKRFPVPNNFGVSPESRIERGRTWPAPAGATRVKALEIYRYDPDSKPIRVSIPSKSISTIAARCFWTPSSGSKAKSIRRSRSAALAAREFAARAR